MTRSATPAIERIARVLAGFRLSANGEGAEDHAAATVDMEWQDEIESALAVLKTLREPDLEMEAAGDAAVWKRMIAAAIGEPINLGTIGEATPVDPKSDPHEPGSALASGSPASEHIQAGGTAPVRDAGPDDIRDEKGEDFSSVDDDSDESFPASDPPSYSREREDR